MDRRGVGRSHQGTSIGFLGVGAFSRRLPLHRDRHDRNSRSGILAGPFPPAFGVRTGLFYVVTRTDGVRPLPSGIECLGHRVFRACDRDRRD